MPSFKLESFLSIFFGGFAGGFGACFSHPFDTVKIRTQLLGENVTDKSRNPFIVMKNIIKHEGFLKLYTGLDCSLMRQLTYGSTRLGLSKYCLIKRKNQIGRLPIYEKIIITSFTGMLASIIGAPFDITLVRFQSDASLPKKYQRNYKNFFDAFSTMLKYEGPTGFFKGILPMMFRAMLICTAQIATFDEMKERINDWRDIKVSDFTSRLYAALVTAFVMCIVSLPADNIKVKLQKQKKINGVLPYNGIFDCIKKSVKREGFSGLWSGFSAMYLREIPHCIVTLLTLDYLVKTFIEKGSDLNKIK